MTLSVVNDDMPRTKGEKVVSSISKLIVSANRSIEALTSSINGASIIESDVSGCIDRLEMTKKEKILAEHKNFCGIWQGETDKRWKTKVPDYSGTKRSILLAKSTRENLEKSIIEYYEKHYTPRLTLSNIYNDWINYKETETSSSNAYKLQYVWEKYYQDSDLVKLSLGELSVGTIKDFIYKTLDDNNLTRRQYMEMKSIINQMLDYCVEHEYTAVNNARLISFPRENKFANKKIKPANELVYFKDEKQKAIDKAMALYERTDNTAYLAIILNFSLGLRVGELASLKISDIKDHFIQIEREEIRTFFIDEKDGRLHKNGVTVVDHTKTRSGSRLVPLTPNAKKYINLVLEHNKEHNLKHPDDYLFLNKDGTRKCADGIDNVLRHVNGTRNEKDGYDIVGCPSGNHSIRRTYISQIYATGEVPNATITEIAGHKDISTTLKSYVHPIAPVNDYADIISKAVD